MKTLKMLFVILFVVALMFAFAAPTMVVRADGNTPPGPVPGIDRYLAILGIASIPTDAQCGTGAGSGAFGFFGKDLNLAGGANGVQTGLNNSAVCGNRQGNLP